MRKRRSWAFLLPLLLMTGCAGIPLSEQTLSQVDPTVEYADIIASPDKYEGAVLLLGGQIVDNQTTREGAVLEILRYHLSSAGRPIEVDEVGGRFLVRSERFLDPEVYEPGRFITLTGAFAGRETKPLKEIEYTYPVFHLLEAHLWRENTGYIYPYGPYYYSPPYYTYPYYDPFWSPFGPPRYYRDPFWRHPWW